MLYYEKKKKRFYVVSYSVQISSVSAQTITATGHKLRACIHKEADFALPLCCSIGADCGATATEKRGFGTKILCTFTDVYCV